jgi:hypothetical protein
MSRQRCRGRNGRSWAQRPFVHGTFGPPGPGLRPQPACGSRMTGTGCGPARRGPRPPGRGDPATPPEGHHVGPFGAGHLQDQIGRPSAADLQAPTCRRGVAARNSRDQAARHAPAGPRSAARWRHRTRAGSRSRRPSRRTSARPGPRPWPRPGCHPAAPGPDAGRAGGGSCGSGDTTTGLMAWSATAGTMSSPPAGARPGGRGRRARPWPRRRRRERRRSLGAGTPTASRSSTAARAASRRSGSTSSWRRWKPTIGSRSRRPSTTAVSSTGWAAVLASRRPMAMLRLARQTVVHRQPVRAAIESMNGARFIGRFGRA